MPRTTLDLPDAIYRQLRKRAAEAGLPLKEVAAEALRKGLERVKREAAPPRPWKAHSLGKPAVDISDRDAIQRAMEEED